MSHTAVGKDIDCTQRGAYMEDMTKRKWAKIRRSVAFDAATAKWLDAQAENAGVSVAEFIRWIIAGRMKEEKR